MTPIFWERHNPQLTCGLAGAPPDLRYWGEARSRRTPHWAWLTAWSENFQFHRFSTDTARGHIQDAHQKVEREFDDPGMLVVYAHLSLHSVSCAIVGAPLTRLHGFTQESPEWWTPGIISPMARRLQHVEHQLKFFETSTNRPQRALKESVVAFHCSRCGLPDDKHVPHEPPDVPKPPEGAPPQAWVPWMRAAVALYRGALQSLTDEELLRMPLGVNKRWLTVMAEELKRRNDNIPIPVMTEPPTALDLLLGDD